MTAYSSLSRSLSSPFIFTITILLYFLCPISLPSFPSSLFPSSLSSPLSPSLSPFVSCGRDLYNILGVSRDADDSAIKKAYRKLSLKYHPDKNPGDEDAHNKYMDIQFANEVLSDPDKRQTYDVDGEEGLEAEKQGGNRGPSSIFDFFGMGGGGGGQGGKRKGPDYKMELAVSLEDLYNGAARSIKIARNVLCKACKGTGAAEGKTTTCPVCKGKGQVTSLQSLGPGFNVQMQTPCDRCGGKGKMAAKACPVCGGSKLVMEEKQLDVIIEKGMPDGYEVKFDRASEQSPDHIPGDVVVTLKTAQHAKFKRDKNDLHMEHTITLKEALLGFTHSFTHLDGRKVVIDQEDHITHPDQVKKLSGEGMPEHEASSLHGDLYVKFKINFPKKLTQQQQEAVSALLEK